MGRLDKDYEHGDEDLTLEEDESTDIPDGETIEDTAKLI